MKDWTTASVGQDLWVYALSVGVTGTIELVLTSDVNRAKRLDTQDLASLKQVKSLQFRILHNRVETTDVTNLRMGTF